MINSDGSIKVGPSMINSNGSIKVGSSIINSDGSIKVGPSIINSDGSIIVGNGDTEITADGVVNIGSMLSMNPSGNMIIGNTMINNDGITMSDILNVGKINISNEGIFVGKRNDMTMTYPINILPRGMITVGPLSFSKEGTISNDNMMLTNDGYFKIKDNIINQ